MTHGESEERDHIAMQLDMLMAICTMRLSQAAEPKPEPPPLHRLSARDEVIARAHSGRAA
jgi:hypothetical protein